MEKTVCRFESKLVKMIKDRCGEFDDYSVSPKIRHILLHLGYELKKSFAVIFSLKFLFFYPIKDESLLIQQRINIAKSKEKLF